MYPAYTPLPTSDDDDAFLVPLSEPAVFAAPAPVASGTDVAAASSPAPAGTLEARVEQMEAFNEHLAGMVESLVDTILHVRNHDVAQLQTQVRDLEQQLH